MRSGTCAIEGCVNTQLAKKLCATHYTRLRKYGDVSAHVPVRPQRKRGEGNIHNGYKRLYNSDACGPTLIFEHVLVMQEVVGRQLRKGETVHHKNGDRLDNRPENLELWVDRGQHQGQRVSDRIEDALLLLGNYLDDPTQWPTHLQEFREPLRGALLGGIKRDV